MTDCQGQKVGGGEEATKKRGDQEMMKIMSLEKHEKYHNMGRKYICHVQMRKDYVFPIKKGSL